MTQTYFAKFTLIAATSAAVTAVVIVGLEVDKFPVSTGYADVLRYFVMLQAGMFLGLLALATYTISKIKLDPSDKLLRPLGAWALSSVILVVFALLSCISMLHEPFVSWKTPLIFIGLVIGDWAGFLLLFRIRHILAKSKKATIKLTILDTSEPGPVDRDLDSGHPVVH